jgi:hypothetical protein
MNVQQDPFSQYRINKSQSQSTQKEKPEKENNPFEQYKIKKEEEPSFLSEIPRHATRIGSRVVETVGGAVGDIQDLIQAGVFLGVEKLTGNKVSEEGKKFATKLSRYPTSKELKEFSETSTEGYTKAKNSGEEQVDEYAETVASLLGPVKFRKALGLAAIGTGSKKAAEALGFGKEVQEVSKVGSIVLASMYNPQGVKKLISNYYNEAYGLAPKELSLNATPLEKKLTGLSETLSEGLNAPSEKAAMTVVNDLKNKIKNGTLSLREAMASNRSINEIMGDPTLLKRGRNLMKEIKKGLNETISSYENSDFQKAWTSANEAFGGLNESQKMSRFILRNIGQKPLAKGLFTLAFEGLSGHPEAIIPTAAGIGATIAGVKSLEFLHRLVFSPTIRKYYSQVVLNAAHKNSRAMIKSSEKLENALEKEDKKKVNKSYRPRSSLQNNQQ